MSEAPKTDAAAQPHVEVQDLDQFVRILVNWHSAHVARSQQLLLVPEGTAFQIGEGAEATELILEGPTLAGFKFGVEMVLMQLGHLPFVAQVEGEAPTQLDGTKTH